ncbi:MAG TPA: hypothetical protein VIY48_06855 [Candidatus Paceibacterota bacterium]
MLTIPLKAVPAQKLNVLLGGQQVNLSIYTLPQKPIDDTVSLFEHTMLDELFATADGRKTQFYLSTNADILIQRVETLSVYVAGILTAVTIAGGYVTFATAPAFGAALTATGKYLYRNREPAFYPPALFIDVAVDNVPIVSCVPCLNLQRVINADYLGFVGDLRFNDTQGTNDPTYDGLGTRYVLNYLEASEL